MDGAEGSHLTDADIAAMMQRYPEGGATLLALLKTRQAADIKNGHLRTWNEPRHLWTETTVFQSNDCATYTRGRWCVKHYYGENPAPISNGELARAYLNACVDMGGGPWKKGLSFPHPPRKPGENPIPAAPLFFDDWAPAAKGKMVYVDIRRCYPQLMMKLGGPGLMYRHDLGVIGYYDQWTWVDTDFPLNMRGVGRAMHGVLCGASVPAFHKGEPVHRSMPRFACPDLAAWVIDICHAIARDAVDQFGCLRWHTDGGIFPWSAGHDFRRYLAEIWEVDSAVKFEGYGILKSLNTFNIGGVAHGRWGLTPGRASVEDMAEGRHGYNTLRPVDVTWLRDTLRYQPAIQLPTFLQQSDELPLAV